jgi:hypothetical protein
MPATPRTFAVLFVLLAAACTGTTPAADDPTPGGATPTETVTAPPSGKVPRAYRKYVGDVCDLPQQWLLRTWRGYLPERSGQLQILPKEPNFVGSGLPHVGPWDYVQDVPMFWYGPGFIRPQGEVERPVTSAGIAPTQAALLGFDHQFPDGQPMSEALLPASERPQPPKLIVTVVWDGAGMDVLDEWPDAWTNLRSLVPEGTFYEHATVGSSPTSSAQIHATIGTGAFPREHGVVGHQMFIDGEVTSPWRGTPELLELPTLADLYDRARGNEPLMGGLGTASIQMGFLGHGAYSKGGDKDLVVLREGKGEGLAVEGDRWNLSKDFQRFFEFPDYANDLPALSRYVDQLDAEDGARDGRWLGHDLEQEELLEGGFHTPARIPFQTRLVEEVIAREGFGRDDVPDMLFVNYKLIDYVGHTWSLNSEEMRESLRTQDQYLPRLIDILDREVGRGRWAMLVTADHGSTPSPQVTGGFQISTAAIHTVLQSFDTDGDDVPIDMTVKQTEVLVNEAELRENGHDLSDVADALLRLTQAESPIAPEQPIPDPDARVFRLVYPAILLESLPCLKGVVED